MERPQDGVVELAAQLPAADAARLRIADELQSLLAPVGDGFPSLADAIYERLWSRLVNLEFPPGGRLSDDALAKELGVSRTPVREALLRLGEVGLVRVTTRRGFAVPAIDAADAAELYDVRAAIEGFATRRATPLLTDTEIADHRARQREAHAQARGDSAAASEAFFRADLALHELLQRKGGNRRSARILADVMGQLSLLAMRSALNPSHRVLAIGEHTVILDALAERDPAAAAAAMEAHLAAVKVRAIADLAAAPAGGPS